MESELYRFVALRFGFLVRFWCSFRRWWYSNEIVDVIDATPTSWRRVSSLQPTQAGEFRVVAISDTHGYHRSIRNLPDGDMLIHCGDILYESSLVAADKDSIELIRDFNDWMGDFPHHTKIVIGGNHGPEPHLSN